MTEAEWLASSDPEAMLRHLGRPEFFRTRWHGYAEVPKRGLPRKAALFLVHAYRRGVTVGPPGDLPRELRALGRFADGLTDSTHLAYEIHPELARLADDSVGQLPGLPDVLATLRSGTETLGRRARLPATRAASHAAGLLAVAPDHLRTAVLTLLTQFAVTAFESLGEVLEGVETSDSPALRRHAVELAVQADLLRELVGNPYGAVHLPPECLTPDAVAVARTVDKTGDFAGMPVLADALEEAGCTDAGVLGHCRGPGGHVRGCWVVDRVLGKA